MTTLNMLQIVGTTRMFARIDQETLTDLTISFDRVVNTLGTIAAVLELAKNKSVAEKKRHLRAVVDLAFRGHRALKAFSRQWALVLEENKEPFFRPSMDDFAAIFEEAKHITIPDPPPGSARETEVTDALCEVTGTSSTQTRAG